MPLTPFLKWAGGKRWLLERGDFAIPTYTGRYIEPFLGGGAVFFSLAPQNALLSDANAALIETYVTLRDDWRTVVRLLGKHHKRHSIDYYYAQRASMPASMAARAARFVYLNRACWNGLYRVNRKGQFNVPIGTKNWVLSDQDDFKAVSDMLRGVTILAQDFEVSVNAAQSGDLVFVDPPYTVAHNFNGFVKYNESIFTCDDQVRLRDSLLKAVARGARVIVTNADHPSISELYADIASIRVVSRRSVISGISQGRRATTELLIEL